MMRPYWQDNTTTLYHGDALQLLPLLPAADAIVTDPPYGETSLEWDVWPDGWPALAMLVANQVWCFGSMRMFLEKGEDFRRGGWKLAQDVVWEKHNGSNNANDRFRRLHELALHFYRGDWDSVFKAPQFTNDATPRTVRRKARPQQWGDIGAGNYTSADAGPRLRAIMRVQYLQESGSKPHQCWLFGEALSKKLQARLQLICRVSGVSNA